MSQLFSQYGLFLISAVLVLLFASLIEAGKPVVPVGQMIVARYPFCLKLVCVLFLIISVFFAFAVAAVRREPPLTRLGIWSMLGVPSLLLSLEVFGRCIVLNTTSVSRSSFNQRRFSHCRDKVLRITYDQTLQAFRVLFADGATLRLPSLKRGSQQVARMLAPPV